MDDLPNEFEFVLLGTGLPISLLAGALARIGKTVLQLDKNDFYGSGKFCFRNQIIRWFLKINFQNILIEYASFSAREADKIKPKLPTSFTNVEVEVSEKLENPHRVTINTGVHQQYPAT